ncbi:hypothetical protein BIY22_16030 [Vibrio panuliri]|uniref:Nickel/cobalt efflux system n=1 Tax=Vibrio panuliri TaxID=1381081 RepID=A0A1Q9HNE2_9VIBR|nr:hypothetical protein [Vibrio panuliri]OLQ92321.1 hypothetical protein BIY22_16030 [Vibrio panuliri]
MNRLGDRLIAFSIVCLTLAFFGKYWNLLLINAMSVQREVGNILTDTIYAFQDNQGWNSLWIVVLSYLCGMVHALGPGHGKAVTCAYLIAHKTTITTALLITSATSLLQTLTTLLIMTISCLVTSSINHPHPMFNVVSQVSCFGLVIFGLLSVWGSFCGASKANSVYGLILALGCRPCISTLMAMLFSSMLNLHYVGLLASFSIALGVTVTTSILACMVLITKSALSCSLVPCSQNISRVLQIVSGILIVVLAVMMSRTNSLAVIPPLQTLSL